MILFNKYQIIEKIGGGTFGSIYKSKNIKTGEYCAIKIEKGGQIETKTLNRETKILLYLGKNSYTPNIKWYGIINDKMCLIMSLFRISLKEVNKLDLSIANMRYVAMQLIDIFSFLNRKQVIHRDIKPANFMYDMKMKNIYLIDFGLAISGSYNQQPPTNIIGTPNFISVQTHDLKISHYADDLEAVGYVICFLCMQGKLYWDNDTIEVIKDKKMLIINEYFIFCRNNYLNDKLDYKNAKKLLIRMIDCGKILIKK
jgi:serine/threonine protein kinase